MRHAITLTLLGLALAVVSAQMGGIGVLSLWLGIDFLLLGIAHFRKAHGLFGKRPDGTLPLWSWTIFFPLLSLSIIVWHLARLFSAEPPFNQVTSQLVIGRRLLSREKPGNFANYIDLTAEFQEPRDLRECPSYFAFPVLDASAPTPECLYAAISRLRPGSTFIHCAQGHGRTGLFALAVLLASGAVRTVDEGLSLLANARPAIRLSREQANCIRAYAITVS